MTPSRTDMTLQLPPPSSRGPGRDSAGLGGRARSRPDDYHLIHVVSLRDLVVTDSTTRIMDTGEHRGLLKVTR